jgi:hypothetical protein
MIIDINIETLFPEGLSDEAISAINDVLADSYAMGKQALSPTETIS